MHGENPSKAEGTSWESLLNSKPKEFFQFPEQGPDQVQEGKVAVGGDRNSPLRILIVDDNALIVEMLTGLFGGREGFDVHVAQDGVGAIREMLAFEPHLVILDIMLGDDDGRNICRQLKSTGPATLKVIAMSGYIPLTEISTLAEHGFDHYIRKPFHMEDVLRLIQKVSAQRQSA